MAPRHQQRIMAPCGVFTYAHRDSLKNPSHRPTRTISCVTACEVRCDPQHKKGAGCRRAHLRVFPPLLLSPLVLFFRIRKRMETSTHFDSSPPKNRYACHHMHPHFFFCWVECAPMITLLGRGKTLIRERGHMAKSQPPTPLRRLLYKYRKPSLPATRNALL